MSTYRMHALIPIVFDIEDKTYSLTDSIEQIHKIVKINHSESTIMKSLLYNSAGALSLHNHPTIPIKDKNNKTRFINLAEVDIMRDRTRGILKFNSFRRHLGLKPILNFNELSESELLKRVYKNNIEDIDYQVGLLCEEKMMNCAFGETTNAVFTVLVQRRMESDRFFTDDYNEETYTEEGMRIINECTMNDIIERHYGVLYETKINNPFFNWTGGHVHNDSFKFI